MPMPSASTALVPMVNVSERESPRTASRRSRQIASMLSSTSSARDVTPKRLHALTPEDRRPTCVPVRAVARRCQRFVCRLPRAGFGTNVHDRHFQVVGAMESFTLSVNGRKRTVDVAADTPLLWVLRDHLDLTGTKFGCGAGLCGACTVHLDGMPLRSCSLPISAVGAKKITTIEGLGTEKTLHAVQKAWIAEDVPQCGYCQSGQLMAAAALLAKNRHPSDADIDTAMTNICRCGTYQRVRKAIRRAAQEVGT